MSRQQQPPDPMFVHAVECVDRGIDLLDRAVPGWHNKIRVDMLNLSSRSYCVLGQVRPGEENYVYEHEYERDGAGYMKGRQASVLTRVRGVVAEDLWGGGRQIDTAHYGFERPDRYSARPYEYYSMLTELWAAEVKKRQGADHASGV